MLIAFLAINVASTIILCFLVPISIPEGEISDIGDVSPIHPIKIVWKSFPSKLVIPLAIYNGLR